MVVAPGVIVREGDRIKKGPKQVSNAFMENLPMERKLTSVKSGII